MYIKIGRVLELNEQSDPNQPLLPTPQNQPPEVTLNTPSTEQTWLMLRKSRQLVHDLRQPLAVLLGELELGAFDGGIMPHKCEQLIDLTLQMRYELQSFYEFLNRIPAASSL